MTAYLAPQFDTQFFDGQTVAAGYKLYTYDSGTTTPKAVYTDQAGLVPHTNPITLDADGRVPGGQLWLGTGEYTFVLKTAGGSTIFTRNDVGSVNNSAEALRADLASASDATKGPGQIGYTPALNYVAGTLGSVINDGELDAMALFTDAERNDVRGGLGTINVQPKLDSITAIAAALGKSIFVPAGCYKSTSTWVVPKQVGIRGESLGWPEPVFDPGSQWRFGPVIFKAHNGDGITKTGASAYDTSAPISFISVSSNRTTYPGGRGVVLDKTGTCDLTRVMVFGCAGDGIVVGTSAGDVTGHTVLSRCYVNNCGGVAYKIRGKWCSLDACLSDGCTWGLWLQDAPETKIGAGCHFEGFSAGGVRFAGACTSSDITGKTFVSDTAGAGVGIVLEDVPGNSLNGLCHVKLLGPSVPTSITFTSALVAATSGTLSASWSGTTGSYGVYFSDGSVKTVTLTNGSAAVSWTGAVTATASATALSHPGSIGIDIKGTAALGTVIDNAEINNWAIGVSDIGTTRTRIIKTDFFQCGLPISSSSTHTRYRDNYFDSTVGTYDIDHVGGGSGTWCDNDGSKPFKATASGVPGNFGTNRLSGNKAYKTKAAGVTSVLIASGAVIPHGLATGIVPSRASGIPYTPATYTNFRVGTIDATNIAFLWDGGASLQIQWEASASCEWQ